MYVCIFWWGATGGISVSLKRRISSFDVNVVLCTMFMYNVYVSMAIFYLPLQDIIIGKYLGSPSPVVRYDFAKFIEAGPKGDVTVTLTWYQPTPACP